jgi:endonuclease III
MPRESLSATKERAGKIVRLLRKQYPDACCALTHTNVHQLMVATILSAQCTDERVNIVTPALFAKYPTVEAFARADINELEKLIYTTGFFRAKAKSIKKSAQALIEKFDGQIPRTLAELVELPGVGRKTGSVILGVGYGLAEGIVVDTHVSRISRLLGFTRQTDPVKIEQDLMKIISKRDWIDFSHLMIWHGRSICKARTPDCPHCPLKGLCPGADL